MATFFCCRVNRPEVFNRFNHWKTPNSIFLLQIQVINGVVLISWRQAVLQRQIDYGAKLGHGKTLNSIKPTNNQKCFHKVVLSLAKMELDNFFKSVMPVADYFDQSDMLVAVSRQTNFPYPTLICWPFRSTANVHLPRCTKTFARLYSTFCRRKKTRKRYLTESLASGTALTTFLVVLSALKLHQIRVKQGTMLQLQRRQTPSNLRLRLERKWTVTSAGTS